METKTFKSKITKSKKNINEINFALEGDISLKNINEIKTQLDNDFSKIEKVNFILNNIDSIDITFVQLIVSLKNSFKYVSISHNLSEDILKLFKISGLNSIIKPN